MTTSFYNPSYVLSLSLTYCLTPAYNYQLARLQLWSCITIKDTSCHKHTKNFPATRDKLIITIMPPAPSCTKYFIQSFKLEDRLYVGCEWENFLHYSLLNVCVAEKDDVRLLFIHNFGAFRSKIRSSSSLKPISSFSENVFIWNIKHITISNGCTYEMWILCLISFNCS
jgi:hypothetical protein